MSKIKCKLEFHYPKQIGDIDITFDGETKSFPEWLCEKCNKTWIANKKYSIFKFGMDNIKEVEPEEANCLIVRHSENKT